MFKDKLKDAMQELRLNQTKLCQLTGVNKSSICQYLSGRNVPSEDRRRKMALSLGLPEEYFDAEPVYTGPTVPKLTPKEVAKIMGVSEKTIGKGLREGVFPWGYAIPPEEGDGGKWFYFINARRFAEIEMVELEGIA